MLMNQEGQNPQQQAGWVFSPGGGAVGPVPVVSPVAAPAPTPPVIQNAAPIVSNEVPVQSIQQPYVAVQPQSSQTTQDPSVVSWSSSEYIANPKNASWFMILGVGSVVLSAAIYLLTKDKISIVAILSICIIVGVFAARKPRDVQYALDRSGMHMGEKFYPYGAFKSFSIVQETISSHVSLMPLKRFMPPVALHYAAQDEDKIVETLGDYLPYEEHKPDVVENFSRRVRF